MKLRNLIIGLVLAGMTTVVVDSQAQTRRYNSKPGALKMRLEGTSNIHDWQAEGKIIGGYIEAGANFPTEPGKEVKPGKLDAKVEAFVPVRSLASVESDGKPYSTKMDDIMYEKLKASDFQRMQFDLDELTLKEAPKAKDQPYVCEAKGRMAVAGVTNQVTMTVNITPMPNDMLRVTGTVPLKMTAFKIDPPAPKIALGMIKTGDDVKVIFDWQLAEKKAK